MKVFKRALPADFKVRWKAVLHGADEFASPGLADPTVETSVTLAQGLKNTRHTLEIMGDETIPIAALRVFRPPLKVQRRRASARAQTISSFTGSHRTSRFCW